MLRDKQKKHALRKKKQVNLGESPKIEACPIFIFNQLI